MGSCGCQPDRHDSDDTHAMNAGVDLLKIEMLKLLASRSETKKARE